MAITKEKKEKIVSKFNDIVGGSKSIVFVKFHKLSVKDTTELRKKLREESVGYTVGKKTLLKRALDGKTTGDMPILEGEIAIAYGTDLIAPAREVFNFQKEHKDGVKIVGGVFEGKFMTEAEMMSIATIPSREVLLSQIAFLLKSPMQRLAIAVNAVAGQKA